MSVVTHKIVLHYSIAPIKTTGLLLLLFFTVVGFSQTQGKIEVIQSPLVDSLIEITRNNPSLTKIEGFRIQIFMESGNQAVSNAQTAIAQFQTQFPEFQTYLSFGQPYYRVRVGNFRTRLEAENQLRNILLSFSKAFIIKEIIDPPALFSTTINTPEP
jgi:hypothetical protein